MKIPRVNKSESGVIEDQNYLLQWPFNMVILIYKFIYYVT